MKRIIVLFGLLFPLLLEAQQINAYEYFFDLDPGTGKGMLSTLTTPSDSMELSLNINTAGLSPGSHVFGFRTRNTLNHWSQTYTRSFNINNYLVPPNDMIESAEYFFDRDPGNGNGIPLPVNSGNQIDPLLSVNTTGLAPGTHLIGIRTKSSDDLWSKPFTRSFYIDAKANLKHLQIVAGEYFFNTDPGAGNGIPYDLTDEDSVLSTIRVEVPFDSGIHKLVIRTKDASGTWSHSSAKEFNLCSTYGALSDFDFSVNRRNVIFRNLSEYDTSFQWKFGDGITATLARNPEHVYDKAGTYNVCLESRNECAVNTLCKQVPVNGLQSVYPSYSANTNRALVHVKGVGFNRDSRIVLSRQGTTIEPDTIIYISSTDLKLQFVFNGNPPGRYDLILAGTNTTPDTLRGAYELQGVSSSGLKLTHFGVTRVRLNVVSSNRFTVTNTGNQSLYMIPFIILIPAGDENYVFPKDPIYTDPSLDPAIREAIPPRHMYSIPNPWNPDGPGYTVIGAVLPMLGPGESADFPINVNSPVERCTELNVMVGKPLDDDFINPFTNSCNFLPDGAKCLMDLAGFIPGVGCVTGTLNFGCAVGNEINDALWGTNKSHWYDLVANFGGMILSCFGGKAPLALAQAASDVSKYTGFIGSTSDCGKAIFGDDQANRSKSIRICHRISRDPNMILGPEGISDENYINSDQQMDYTILFENLPSATAPAAEVVITNQIDTSLLDMSTFRIRALGFGDTVFIADEDVTKEWITDIDLKKEKHIILRVNASLDEQTGLLTCRFTSFDTLTMDLVLDADLGFLPPNKTAPQGEGFISYSIDLKNGLPHASVVSNSASIVFDTNDPLLTNTWINTVDSEKPESRVEDIPYTMADSTFTMHLNGFDAHSGIKFFNVYYSMNDSEIEPLLTAIWDDSLQFTGKDGMKYAFYSQAIDHADNVEDIPDVADAVTEIHIPLTGIIRSLALDQIVAYPNPVSDVVEILVEKSNSANMLYAQILDSYGRIISGRQEIRNNRARMDISNYEPGVYILSVVDGYSGETRGVISIIKL